MKIIMLLLFLMACSPANAIQDAFSLRQQIVVNATTTSTLALAANPLRKYLMIQNNGTAVVSVTFNAAQTSTEGVQIVAGGNYEPFKASADSVYLKASSGSQSVVLIEGQ